MEAKQEKNSKLGTVLMRCRTYLPLFLVSLYSSGMIYKKNSSTAFKVVSFIPEEQIIAKSLLHGLENIDFVLFKNNTNSDTRVARKLKIGTAIDHYNQIFNTTYKSTLLMKSRYINLLLELSKNKEQKLKELQISYANDWFKSYEKFSLLLQKNHHKNPERANQLIHFITLINNCEIPTEELQNESKH